MEPLTGPLPGLIVAVITILTIAHQLATAIHNQHQDQETHEC